MADVKTPTAPKPTTPINMAKLPAQNNGEQSKETMPVPTVKDKRAVQQIVWPTAETALAEATKRTYGPRKAYTVTVGGKTVHCVAYNDQYAAYEAFVAAGGVIDELGGTTRARKISADAVLAAAQQMSPEALKALKDQLAKL